MEYPKLKLQHKNTNEIFYVVGIVKEDNVLKYKLQSQSNLKDHRNVKISTFSIYYYNIGNYD